MTNLQAELFYVKVNLNQKDHGQIHMCDQYAADLWD